jgi:hypothetical protein
MRDLQLKCYLRFSFEDWNAIEKQKIYKSPGIDQIMTKMVQVGGKGLRFEIHKHSFVSE